MTAQHTCLYVDRLRSGSLLDSAAAAGAAERIKHVCLTDTRLPCVCVAMALSISPARRMAVMQGGAFLQVYTFTHCWNVEMFEILHRD